MKVEDISEVAVGMAMVTVRDIGLRMWHKMNACSCDGGWVLPGVPCEIGREEIAEAQRLEFFSRWDALGLGYIGPRT